MQLRWVLHLPCQGAGVTRCAHLVARCDLTRYTLVAALHAGRLRLRCVNHDRTHIHTRRYSARWIGAGGVTDVAFERYVLPVELVTVDYVRWARWFCLPRTAPVGAQAFCTLQTPRLRYGYSSVAHGLRGERLRAHRTRTLFFCEHSVGTLLVTTRAARTLVAYTRYRLIDCVAVLPYVPFYAFAMPVALPRCHCYIGSLDLRCWRACLPRFDHRTFRRLCRFPFTHTARGCLRIPQCLYLYYPFPVVTRTCRCPCRLPPTHRLRVKLHWFTFTRACTTHRDF